MSLSDFFGLSLTFLKEPMTPITPTKENKENTFISPGSLLDLGEAKFKKGHIVLSNQARVGTIWADPVKRGSKIVYKMGMKTAGGDKLMEVSESQLHFRHDVACLEDELQFLEGDIVRHKHFGYGRYRIDGLANQIGDIDNQVTPGNVSFRADVGEAELVVAGPVRIAKAQELASMPMDIRVAHEAMQLVDSRVLPLDPEMKLETLKGFFTAANVPIAWIETLRDLLVARDEDPGGISRVVEKTKEKSTIQQQSLSPQTVTVLKPNKILTDVSDKPTDGNSEGEVETTSHRPSSFSSVPARNKHFDTSRFKRYNQHYGRKKITTAEKLQIELENLELIGLRKERGKIILPIGGIPVSRTTQKRLSFVGYSTVDLEAANVAGDEGYKSAAVVRESDLVRNPPMLSSRHYKAVRSFCQRRDKYLSDLAKAYNEHGHHYEPRNLLSCIPPEVSDWLASQFNIEPVELNVLHVDAFLNHLQRFDPYGVDQGTTLIDIFKELKVRYFLGDLLHSYVHDLVATVKKTVRAYDILDLINSEAKTVKDCVEAVCKHLPEDIGKEALSDFQFAVKDKSNPMFKNFFEFLETLLENTNNGVRINKQTFPRSKLISSGDGETPKVFAVTPFGKDRDCDLFSARSTESNTKEIDSDDEVQLLEAEIAFQKIAKEEKTCWVCNSPGHMVRDCPKPLTVDQRRNIALEKLRNLKAKVKETVAKRFSAPLTKDTTKRISDLARAHINSLMFDMTEAEDSNLYDQDIANAEKALAELGHIEVTQESVALTLAAAVVEKTNSPENTLWEASAKIDKVDGRRKAAIFPASAFDRGLAVSIKTKYLGDSGCLGFNLGGSELLDEAVSRGLPFEIKKLKEPLDVRCAWQAKAQITHLMKVTIACSTTHGFPLVEKNVFIHLLNTPLHTIFLGTRFCQKVGIKTTNEQIDDEAQRRQMLSKSKKCERESDESIMNELENFTLERPMEQDKAHCIEVKSVKEVVHANNTESYIDDAVTFFVQSCQEAFGSSEIDIAEYDALIYK